ncbi:hypothetical protein ACO0LO_15740 [Undibacterium sp. TJN25]|uniref:hypothetical protein n=1 Tax=Undibacterium sp. TJN25 TaxID=3413056 RepID=UPI003BF1D8BE
MTIEPDSDNDKVDLLWEYEGRKTAVQVKSSKNPIGRADVKKWCADLRAEKGADHYELRLAGLVSAGALSGNDLEGVSVPTPTSVVVQDLMEQAITKLDRYLINSGIDTVPLPVRASLVDICAAKLITGSVSGSRVERKGFDGWLLHWITTAYPEALTVRLSANCEVLWGSVDFLSPILGERAFQLATPLTVYNSGRGVAIVEWIIIHVRTATTRMLYKACNFRQDGKIRPFSDFAVGPGQVLEKDVLYSPVSKSGFEIGAWPLGNCELELFVKFGNDETPRTIKKATMTIAGTHMALLNREDGAMTFSISTLDTYLNSF